MFKESPTLSKEEKTLILGFMAGARGLSTLHYTVVIAMHTHMHTHTHTYTPHTHTHTTHTRHTHTHTHTHTDNPNPAQPIMTIKLSEKHEAEEVPTPSLAGGVVKRNVLYETVFEMNYTNGQWRKLQIKRAFPTFAT